VKRQKLKPPHTAPPTRDVLAVDNHGFATRMRRSEQGAWFKHRNRHPTFDDRDIAGWIEMPSLPEGVK